jgi:hypothetical protein
LYAARNFAGVLFHRRLRPSCWIYTVNAAFADTRQLPVEDFHPISWQEVNASMNSEQKNPNATTEHEKKNEGGREYGHDNQPTQAQQASKNQGLAGNQSQSGQHQGSNQQQSGSGKQQGTGSQSNKPPGNATQEQKKEPQGERKSA